MKKEMLAIILAGGQGSRLGVFTKKIAKPAVSFGGKYRIIDFVLSNCSNSGIDTVGVLTQYRPQILNSYIGIGDHWDLDRVNGGVMLLHPYKNEKEGNWFDGTSNAIKRNMDFIDEYDPEYLLVLSGDHIYKMDYSKMLKFHKEKDAAATIGVIEVDWDEASRFGIMNTDRDNNIYEFDEKPEVPKNNLASMGIYIFNWKVLREYFLRADRTGECLDDFGHDVIPAMLLDKQPMVAYPFKGYWRDVGTIESLWQANMDLINNPNSIDLNDQSWRIYTNTMDLPPQYIGPNASVKKSLIADGCRVFGTVRRSVLSHKVRIGEGSTVEDTVLMPNVKIGKNVTIKRAIIAEGSVVEDGTVIVPENDEIRVVSNLEFAKA